MRSLPKLSDTTVPMEMRAPFTVQEVLALYARIQQLERSLQWIADTDTRNNPLASRISETASAAIRGAE